MKIRRGEEVVWKINNLSGCERAKKGGPYSGAWGWARKSGRISGIKFVGCLGKRGEAKKPIRLT